MHRRVSELFRSGRTFATTRWGVLRAAAGEGQSASSALESLCADYWKPVYAHVRTKIGDVHLAEDLTQEFFARFLSQGWFLRPVEEKGKFRTFLLAVLNRFLRDERIRAQAWKRGGRTSTLALDDVPEIAAAGEAGGGIDFDREWAKALLGRAFEALQAESDPQRFATLAPFLQRPPAQGEYQRLAEPFGGSVNAVAAAVGRMRRRFRELLRLEVAGTVGEADDVDEELLYLLRLTATE